MGRKKKSPRKQSVVEKSTTPFLDSIRVAVGPVFVLGGFSLVSSYFGLGVVCVYIGMSLCLVEICVEPLLLKVSPIIQVSLVGLVFFFLDLFTISVVLARAPLGALAYFGNTEGYPAGEVISGIAWDDKLADVRVALNNPISGDYQSLNIKIVPEGWTYKAAILNGPSGCALSVEPGDEIAMAVVRKGGKETVTRMDVFGNSEFRDTLGNVFVPIASRGGDIVSRVGIFHPI